MIELTPDQERQLRLPERQSMIDETIIFLQSHLPTLYQQRTPKAHAELLGHAYDRATGFGMTRRNLIHKYMLYGLSAPALIEGEAVTHYFQQGQQSPDLLAQDLLALIEMPSANTITRGNI
ncbi:hypothetical protein [Kushneria phyllosphaerae]|uniref:Uncharacterized protein n=1 Tax=Kushneria phyllosphaerae TaxID=2100822 RepID=A0A2R8CKY6_9GAMM|nr:hypothetical protein [Kushneria phyllosphaerae]SPJ33566.1 hypothetical protein KSP9073_01575 [Kushneria phyllosphaerae]